MKKASARNLVPKKLSAGRSKGGDIHMSSPGMAFTNSNPDKATSMTGIAKHPRIKAAKAALVRK